MWAIGILVLLLILGAICGGESFGDTLGKGCGCFVVIIIALVILAVMFFEGMF